AAHGACVVGVRVAVLRQLQEVQQRGEGDDRAERKAVPVDGDAADEVARRRDGDGVRTHRATATESGTRPPPRQNSRRTRHRPARSPAIVDGRSTRESRSSIQSTGTSWIRSPFRSARSSSSVSKNQPSSATWGRRRLATSARSALKPHCASEKPLRNAARISPLYPRESSSRLSRRRTWAE